MKRLFLMVLLLLPLGGCAHLNLPFGERHDRATLWEDAQSALAAGEFSIAERTFRRLATEYPGSTEGRESLFFLGAIRIDPRNPYWNAQSAETYLAEYLAAEEGGDRLIRKPEAKTLHEIARQLNLPPQSRVAGLQPEQPEVVEDRLVVPGSELREQEEMIQQLREQITQRDARIEQLEEELERIRRTLTGPGAPRP